MNSFNIHTAFYDVMFDSNDSSMNELELKALENIRMMLNSPVQLSKRIQPLPLVLLNLIEILKDPNVEYQRLAEVIQQDPSLAARVLKIVNSPIYTSGTEIKNLETAVARLGVTGVANVTSSVIMKKVRPPKPIYFKIFGKQIWIHSLHCAFFCQKFAAEAGEDEFSGHLLGLIHDIGKILIFECLSEALAAQLGDEYPGSTVFKETMSDMSMDTSYFIFKEWNLPGKFCDAIQQQRTGAKSPLAIALKKANSCSEIFLLLEKKIIDETIASNLVDEIGCDANLWEEFCNTGHEVATIV